MTDDGDRIDLIVDGDRIDLIVDGDRNDLIVDGDRNDLIVDGDRNDLIVDGDRNDLIVDGDRNDLIVNGDRNAVADEDVPPALAETEAQTLGQQLFRNQVQPHVIIEGGHVGHLPRGRSGNGPVEYSRRCPACNPLLYNGASVLVTYIDEYPGAAFRTNISALFLVGELTGIGMLAAPWAVVKLGWLGFVLLGVFAVATAYSSTCLGTCWLILEERFLETRNFPVTDPYSTIAFHAFGKVVSIISKILINSTLFGAATVYLMLTADAAHRLFASSHPEVTFCTWLVVFSITMSSLMFVEKPKNSSIVALTAVLTAFTSCYLVMMQIVLDIKNQEGKIRVRPGYEWDSNQFFLSYGTILFCYGGAVSFPIVQNDMYRVNRYSRCLITVFSMMAFVFGTIVVASYIAYDLKIEPNLIMSLGDSWYSYIAIALMAAHLIIGFLIVANPLSHQIETLFNTPQEPFTFQRFIVRMGILVAMVLLGQIVPNFNFLVTLLGGSTISFTTFVLPSLFYLRLCSLQHPNWPDRSLSWKSRLYFNFVITVGLIGCILSIYTVICSLFKLHSYNTPCFWSTLFPAKTSIA